MGPLGQPRFIVAPMVDNSELPTTRRVSGLFSFAGFLKYHFFEKKMKIDFVFFFYLWVCILVNAVSF